MKNFFNNIFVILLNRIKIKIKIKNVMNTLY